MPRESSEVRATRREYEEVKQLCRKVGAKAAGKPKRSQAQRDYLVVKTEYHRLGRKLGRLTGRRSRS
jgi:hypothetical protein